jgi:metal-sulfur cluster biosynthetic enzyme
MRRGEPVRGSRVRRHNQLNYQQVSEGFRFRFPGKKEKNQPQRKCMPLAQDDVLNALKQCYDPEIPVNIVDLGLIYNIRFDDLPEGQQDVTVDMTLTAQGCPEHVNISAQVKSRVEQLPGVRNANVNVIWEPAWTPERLSPEARKQLGID